MLFLKRSSSLWKDAVPRCPNLTITLLFFLRMVCTIGRMMGRLTSQEPGPGSGILSLGFLVRWHTDPKGAYDCLPFMININNQIKRTCQSLSASPAASLFLFQTSFFMEAWVQLRYKLAINYRSGINKLNKDSTVMDMQDFRHNYKYKLLVPGIYILTWVMMFAGPFCFPVIYQKICIFFVLYLTVKSLILITIAVLAFFKNRRILQRAEEMKREKINRGGDLGEVNSNILYGFIIPNYKEDEELLAQTMDKLAEHSHAKEQYLVFLAMESHEEHSDLKAERLVEQFKSKFKLIGYTVHHIREYEQRGKASNVSWCAQHLEQLYFSSAGIDPSKVLLTIIDADSWVPQVYIRQVEDHLSQPEHLKERQKFIYQSNQIFTRNHLDVPIVTRTYDQVHGGMHNNNTMSVFGITFPLSNYSLQFTLAKKIGWWDTCADAIGEDFHMTEKALWKTHGNIECIPVYAPFNQVCIQTGKGAWEDIKARFWQAERHARGVSDVPYNINMLISQPFTWRTFVVFYDVLETFIMPATIPWALTAMTYQSKLLFQYSRPSPELISDSLMSPLFTINTVCLYGSYFFYWLLRRKSTTVLYGIENEHWIRFFEYPLMFFFNMFGITLPCYVIAAYGALFEGREYVVAEKVISKKEHH